jgi:hypothetical protein
MNIPKNENFYQKFRFKEFKFINLETPSINLAAPSAIIPFDLIHTRLNMDFHIFIQEV